MAASSYRPLIAEHIAGIANVTADVLSRLHVPGGAYERPACLAGTRSVCGGPREASRVVPSACSASRSALSHLGMSVGPA